MTFSTCQAIQTSPTARELPYSPAYGPPPYMTTVRATSQRRRTSAASATEIRRWWKPRSPLYSAPTQRPIFLYVERQSSHQRLPFGATSAYVLRKEAAARLQGQVQDSFREAVGPNILMNLVFSFLTVLVRAPGNPTPGSSASLPSQTAGEVNTAPKTGGLSRTATIAIAVVCPLAVLFILALVCSWWIRRKRGLPFCCFGENRSNKNNMKAYVKDLLETAKVAENRAA